MGGGSWTRSSFTDYATTKCMSVTTDGVISGSYSNQDMFKARRLDSALNPKNVMRECCDSTEHPNTIPVILALDVTGSMGDAAVEVAKKLNVVMTKLYEKIADVEFLIMGIGDLAYDAAPIQASQFESDIRIAEQLDKVWFEFGGGGNNYESYTAAWYFGARHTKLDCWNRGKRGIIITMGDELLNPYLPLNGRHGGLLAVTGDSLQGDVETADLYKEVTKKYDVYHLDVAHGYSSEWRKDEIEKSFVPVIGEDHFKSVNMDSIADAIIEIIMNSANQETSNTQVGLNENGEICW